MINPSGRNRHDTLAKRDFIQYPRFATDKPHAAQNMLCAATRFRRPAGSCRRHMTAALSRRWNRPHRDFDEGETSLTMSFMHVSAWNPGSVFGPGVVGKVALLGAVAAGAAIVEAALIPGVLIGGAAVLAPRLLPRDVLSRLGDRLRRAAPSPEASTHSAQAPASGEPASFDTWHAVVKTLTYRVVVTAIDFGANYFVIGNLATAAGLSSLSLVAGPIAYFTHEVAWHYFGPVSSRSSNPLEATVRVPIPGLGEGDHNGRMPFASIKVSRAFAKTVTYEAVTGVSEFGVNYFFIGNVAAAAGLTAFSIVIAPLVYYVHEKAWDYYQATKGRSSVAPARKLAPAA
jgi:uncharacterized membrane protein